MAGKGERLAMLMARFGSTITRYNTPEATTTTDVPAVVPPTFNIFVADDKTAKKNREEPEPLDEPTPTPAIKKPKVQELYTPAEATTTTDVPAVVPPTFNIFVADDKTAKKKREEPEPLDEPTPTPAIKKPKVEELYTPAEATTTTDVPAVVPPTFVPDDKTVNKKREEPEPSDEPTPTPAIKKPKVEEPYVCRCIDMNDGEIPLDIENAASGVEEMLNVELLEHQKQALVWMLGQESSNVKGGILADDQGLGKTVTTLSLISAAGAKSRPMPSSCSLRGGTLVVCPTSLLGQWAKEVTTKVKESHQLSVLVYHGKSRKSLTPEFLATYDVVITTYGTLSMEVPPKRMNPDEDDVGPMDYRGQCRKQLEKAFRNHRNDAPGPLASVHWNRVVLDEAQTIKNAATQGSLACRDLKAGKRWGLSGTPIQNKEKELFSYTRFLKLSPYDKCRVFERSILGPVLKGDYREVRSLLSRTLLRRTKNTLINGKPIVNLPERNVTLVQLELSNLELEFYKRLNSEMSKKVEEYTAQGTLKLNYMSLLTMLLRLRQACDHPVLARKALSSGVLNINVPKNEALEKELLDGTNESTGDEETKVTMEEAFLTSSKISSVMKILDATPSGEKTLVFSQWTSMLDLVAPKLEEAGIKYARLDGSMSFQNRDKAIANFTNNPEVKVMIMSLKAASLGLNLVAANHVILMDLWWNPSTEEQAIDRAHRIGQTRPVQVSKLIVAGTIEERILELQRKKRNMVSTLMGEGSTTAESRLSLDEIMFLFSKN